MAYNRSHARQICSNDELALFNATIGPGLRQTDDKELKNLLDRARKFRDKNKDLFRRQSIDMARQAGSKRGRTGRANDRTQQKEKLFAEVIARIEGEQARRSS
jgi:hypothetical protein